MVVTYRRAKRKGAVKGASPGGKPPITCKTQKIIERDFKAMKKIFAIALALVMVLSMASAFASQCTAGFDWTSTSVSNCGKAKVEVVPYVKVNNGCGGFNWQVSTCAGAVKGENVYYAVKLTVDANVDPEWWDKAELTITTSGLENVAYNKANLGKVGVDLGADKECVYYYNWAEGWKKVASDGISVADDVQATPESAYIQRSVVVDSSKAKVCVKLASTGNNFTEGVVGKYYVKYSPNAGNMIVYDKKGGNALAVYGFNADSVVVTVDYTNAGSCAPNDVASIKAFFGIAEGTKLTQKLVNKNFGWDDKVEDCFKWSGNATALVDPECKIEIPKTGDVSVVAYAVMALVAAAGAMGLKK